MIVSFGLTGLCFIQFIGCSCHPDCKERMNCCYPEDYETVEDNEQANFPYQCLHTRLGQDRYIDGTVPAYMTIVAPPRSGCADSSPMRVTSDVLLRPTCDDINVTPLGPYSPVYSKDTGHVYKNVLCARCHGVKNTEAFQSILVCEKDRNRAASQNSLSENLVFLESKALSPKCYIDYKYASSNYLINKRCYKNLIKTCTADSATHLLKRLYDPPTNLDFVTIQDLCENGIQSQALQEGILYKNIYCAACAKTSINRVPLLCEVDESYRTFRESFTFVLDPKIMHTIEKTKKNKNSREVCVTTRGIKKEACRIIKCPSGKTQNGKGECVLVGNIINTDGILVKIKLTSRHPLDIEKLVDQDRQLLIQRILENKPWSHDWKVAIIMRRDDNTTCHEKAEAIVYLVSRKKDIEAVLRDVNKFIPLDWELDWENKTYQLIQTFTDYEIKRTAISYSPSWQLATNLTGIFGCGLIEWKYVFANQRLARRQHILNRLYFCNQIEMRPEEFTLGPDNTFLESNLTKRVLFDMEFDLIEDEDGMHVRVCLADTIFWTFEANGASVLLRSVMVLLMPLFLTYAFHV